MNLHHLAVKIAKKEKGKTQVDIAQIKEILKIICELEADSFISFEAAIVNHDNSSPCRAIHEKAGKIYQKRQKQKKKAYVVRE